MRFQSIENQVNEGIEILKRNGYQANTNYDIELMKQNRSTYVWGTRVNIIEVNVMKGLPDAEKTHEVYW